jgi:hypothetical protein
MEQKAHDFFTRLAEREGPALGFTADDLVVRGRRRARTRTLGAVAGGVVGVLAVTAAVLPLTGIRSGGPAAATAGVKVTPLPTPDPGCEADLAKLAAMGWPRSGPEKTVTLQACPVAKRIMAALDPDMTHWSEPSPTMTRIPADLVYGYVTGGGVLLEPTWTPDGHVPWKPGNPPQDVGGDSVAVSITITAPGHALGPGLATNHAERGITANGKALGDEPWPAPPSTFALPDGSTVKEWKEQDSAGAGYVLIRTLPSGEQLELRIDGPDSSTGKPSTNKLPFTEQQIIDAVSVSGVEDVRLPMPGLP